jgi:hypothetical protein
LCASEWILRRFALTARALRAKRAEHILGREDARYGWAMLPSRTTLLGPPGAPVPYAIDAWGNRAARDAGSPDPAQPSVIVAGESTAFGYGLAYEQTFAALLGRELGLQVVDVGAGGYGTDQAALRLEDALDRLERPVAAVQVFLLVQLQRNVQDYRPRLALRDGALALVPRASGPFADLRVRDIVVNETPVLFEWQLRDSLAVTGAVLRRVEQRIRARRAAPLFLVVSFGPTSESEEQLVRSLFADPALPFARARVDFAHLLPYDRHPDADASRTLASVAASALRAQTAARTAPAAAPARAHQRP